jgi:GrpB-like predicted nucleotidyltransferase (UPF0157 family)
MGSSAVPGLWSKGDLDILVGVSRARFTQSALILRKMGFYQKRTAHHDPTLTHFTGSGYGLDVGIQLVVKGSEAAISFVGFRDLLLRNKKLRNEYNRLKLNCTGLSHNRYRAIKSCFIEGVLVV